MSSVAHPFAERSPLRLAIFRAYLHAFAWQRFAAVRVARAGLPAAHAGKPLVIYSNHPGWWDPAMFMLVLPKFFPRRLGFAPMEAAQLQRWAMFRRFGAFGVAPGLRGAARFLQVARQGLEDPRALLVITAEGAFTDARPRPLSLRAGIAHLARDLPGVVFLPLALEYCFWNESRPEALLRFGVPISGGGSVAACAARLTAGLTETMDGLATLAIARNKAPFLTVLPGATETGWFLQKLLFPQRSSP